MWLFDVDMLIVVGVGSVLSVVCCSGVDDEWGCLFWMRVGVFERVLIVVLFGGGIFVCGVWLFVEVVV